MELVAEPRPKALAASTTTEITSSCPSSEHESWDHRLHCDEPAVLATNEADPCDKMPALRSADGKSPAWSLYARGIAGVLQVPPPASLAFFAVFLSFKLVKQGKDPLQRYATEYGVLLPAETDAAIVGGLDVNLYLQDFSLVNVCAEAIGSVKLSTAQLEGAKAFTRWIFDLVLGRSQEACESTYGDGPKAYYVLPLLDDHRLSVGKDFASVVDWDTVFYAINSGVHYRHCSGSSAQVDSFDHKALELDTLVVTNDGKPHLVVSRLHQEPSGEAGFHEDYLEACKLYRAISYLAEQGNNGNNELPKKLRPVKLRVKDCIFFTSLRGSIYRGAVRLPSVLHMFEVGLLATELIHKIGVFVSPFKVLEALTSRACGLCMSYEALELLGDSVLKLLVGSYIYQAHPAMDGESLGVELYKTVCNKALTASAQARKLHAYISAEMFSPSRWLAPGPLPLQDPTRQAVQLISARTLADVVEAIIGACAIEGGLMAAREAMRWFHIPVSELGSRMEATTGPVVYTPTSIDLESLQLKLGYTFKDSRLLLTALDFHGDGIHFKRLEFLGDAILDYMTTYHFVKTFPRSTAGELNILKQASVNREHLACVCVRHGLTGFVDKTRLNVATAGAISSFAKALLDECDNGTRRCYGISSQASPKVLGDLIQTIAAAIFLDADFGLEHVWKVYQPLLEPFATPETVVLHPIGELTSLCKQRGLTLDIKCVELEQGSEDSSTSMNQADVLVNQHMLGRSQHEEKRVARRLAAMQALEHLGRHLVPP